MLRLITPPTPEGVAGPSHTGGNPSNPLASPSHSESSSSGTLDHGPEIPNYLRMGPLNQNERDVVESILSMGDPEKCSRYNPLDFPNRKLYFITQAAERERFKQFTGADAPIHYTRSDPAWEEVRFEFYW
uniref:Uncharacterized protein n=1 Tax=Porodaedalea pini TaxID=108901 RepID=A0A5B9RAV6_9AGAM|nr:hypothetical protein PPIT_000081 [Porodaedalea pini]QEG56964.1 hypothetical protein PPIT_000081 [Porodaedalea pini]